jgi:hypothetical protein
MRLFEMTVEVLGSQEMLINGENWQNGRSKAQINEDLAAKLSLEQQWALLTMLHQATLRLSWVYQQSRLKQGDVLESDKARAVRKLKKQTYNPRSKVIVVSG